MDRVIRVCIKKSAAALPMFVTSIVHTDLAVLVPLLRPSHLEDLLQKWLLLGVAVVVLVGKESRQCVRRHFL